MAFTLRRCFLLALLLVTPWDTGISATPSSRKDTYEAKRPAATTPDPRKTNSLRGGFPAGNITIPDIPPCSAQNRALGKCPKEYIPGPERRNFTLQMIRHDILQKLRYDENRLPNATAIPSDYLAALTGIVEMQNDAPQDQYDDDHATTEKIIAFSRTQQVKVMGKDNVSAHYFTFSEKLSNMGVDTATLHVLVKFEGHSRYQHHHKPEFFIRVMQLVSEKKGESPVFNDFGAIKALSRPVQIGETNGRHGNTRWVQIDVRHVFSKWLANTPLTGSRRMGLILDVTDSALNSLTDVSVVSANDLNVNQNPFFEVELSERGKSRSTRNIGLDCHESNKETRCCRYPLTVDFDEFGWDWVIAPKQYEANYCSGECPYAFLQKYPHNHIVQQANPAGVGGPCCTARKLSPITMLHFDQDSNIVFSVLPGMLVDQCGCS